jgi:nitrate/nitrite transporter NarK
LINSIGNLGGFVGPYAIGWIKDATGDVTLGLAVLAAGSIMAGVVAFLMGHDSKMEMAGSRMMAKIDTGAGLAAFERAALSLVAD